MSNQGQMDPKALSALNAADREERALRRAEREAGTVIGVVGGLKKLGEPPSNIESELRAEIAELNRQAHSWCKIAADKSFENAELRAEIAALRGQLEVERMRLACCGVIASSNTRASAEAARSVKPEYWSGSAGDVADAVDREMALRDDLAALRERLVEADYELSGEAMHEAGLTYRTVRVGVEWYESWRASPEVVRALEEKP